MVVAGCAASWRIKTSARLGPVPVPTNRIAGPPSIIAVSPALTRIARSDLSEYRSGAREDNARDSKDTHGASSDDSPRPSRHFSAIGAAPRFVMIVRPYRSSARRRCACGKQARSWAGAPQRRRASIVVRAPAAVLPNAIGALSRGCRTRLARSAIDPWFANCCRSGIMRSAVSAASARLFIRLRP